MKKLIKQPVYYFHFMIQNLMLFMSLVKVMDLLGKIIPRLLQDPTYNFGFVSMCIFCRSLATLPFIMVTTTIPPGTENQFQFR